MPPEETTEKQPETVERSPLERDAPADTARPDAERPSRPEGIPDDFWNDDTGVDVEKLAGGYSELKTYRDEAEAAKSGRPQKAEDFKLELPKDFEAPEGFEIALNEDDPRLPLLREIALKRGWSQDDFSSVVALSAQAEIAEGKMVDERLTKELKTLGTKGAERIKAVTDWLTSKVGNEGANALLPMLITANAVKAFEKIIATKGSVPDFNASNREGADEETVTDEEWDAMTPTQRIVKSRELRAQKGVQRSPA